MRKAHIHLAKPGRILHDIVGPISSPSVGPTLPKQLIVMVTALVWSTPAMVRINMQTPERQTYKVMNDRRVTRLL